MRHVFLSAAVVSILSACSLSPELVRPQMPVPASYPVPAALQAEPRSPTLDWTTVFHDEHLQSLIRTALANNRDLRIATLNAEAVREQHRIQRAARLPAIDVTGTQTRQSGGVIAQGMPGAAPVSGGGAIFEQYAANVGLSAFEVDLFGRVKSLSDAAFARYMASEEGRRAAQVTLIGTVAEAYFVEQIAAEQLVLARSTLADWQKSLDISRRLRAASQQGGLDIAQAEGQVATAQADIEGRIRAYERARNNLRLLVGTDIDSAAVWAFDYLDSGMMTSLPVGLPADLLLQRPDIRQAEHTLIAANADIGAARAAFLPRISLTASTGYASTELGGLFSAPNRAWSFAPQISIPLFNAGRLRSELRLAHIRKNSAVAEYERAIQTAFREVADGLAGSSTYDRQLDAQAAVVAASERRLRLSQLRYNAGMDSRLELLDAQRQQYAARQALLSLRQEQLANAIALFRALGGGVESEAADPASQPQAGISHRGVAPSQSSTCCV